MCCRCVVAHSLFESRNAAQRSRPQHNAGQDLGNHHGLVDLVEHQADRATQHNHQQQFEQERRQRRVQHRTARHKGRASHCAQSAHIVMSQQRTTKETKKAIKL